MSHSRTCPSCQHQMQTHSNGPLAFDQCPNCQGFWYDLGELKTALTLNPCMKHGFSKIERGDDQSDHAYGFVCPDCEVLMEEREYAYDSGIHIDGCPQCKGLFVSAEDLEAIKTFLQSSKSSQESADLHQSAIETLHQIGLDQKAKQYQLATAIDNQFWTDDIISPRLFDWLIAELVDVDSFPLANH